MNCHVNKRTLTMIIKLMNTIIEVPTVFFVYVS